MDEILIVNDSKLNIMMLTNILKDDYKIISAESGAEMFEVLETCEPKLILLDVVMPEMDGFEAIAKLKVSSEYSKIPVIFVTGLSDAGSEEKGFKLGAVDYIGKPFKDNIVRARVKSYIQLYDFIRKTELAGQNDGLTGLYNKKMTEQEIRKQLEDNDLLECGALMIIDIDNFKSINDTFGHLYGDAVITKLGHSLRSMFQKSDILGRVGGDEFFVFLRNYNVHDILIGCAEGVCATFRNTFEQDGVSVKISASIGIATTEYTTNFEELYQYADIALYNTKANGKDGYCFYTGQENINYTSQRTTIENHQTAKSTAGDNLDGFNNSIKEYIFNLVEETSVAGYTIQAILQMISLQFSFNSVYITKLEYADDIVTAHNRLIDSSNSYTKTLTVLSPQSLQLLSGNFNKSSFFESDDSDILAQMGITKEPGSTAFIFALRNKNVLLGYIVFEKNIVAKPDKKIMKNITGVAQHLSTVMISQFLLDNATKTSDNMIAVLNSIDRPVYVTSQTAEKPLFSNSAVQSKSIKFHGANCMTKTGATACDDCPLHAAVETGGVYEDDNTTVTEIEWNGNSKAYVVISKQ